jgi:hypothetical protein
MKENKSRAETLFASFLPEYGFKQFWMQVSEKMRNNGKM